MFIQILNPVGFWLVQFFPLNDLIMIFEWMAKCGGKGEGGLKETTYLSAQALDTLLAEMKMPFHYL